MLVTSYFRCSSACRSPANPVMHRAGAHVDVHLQLPHARRFRQRGTQPPALGRTPAGLAAVDADARIRVPLLVERTRLERPLDVEDAKDRESSPDEHGVAGGRDPEHDSRRDRDAPQRDGTSVSQREHERADDASSGDPEHRRRSIGVVEHGDEQHAAERGAGEIGGVEPADARGKPGQHQPDDDAADDERHGDDHVGERDRVDGDDRRMDAERNAELGQKAQHHRDRKRDGRQRQLRRAGGPAVNTSGAR